METPYMTRPLRIGLDIDGVIAEYKDIPPEDRTPDVYDKLKPVSPEVMATFAALAMCYEVFLVSSRRYPDAQGHTRTWLNRHLGGAHGLDYELLTDVAPDEKWMVAKALKLDYLLDDKKSVFDFGFGCEVGSSVLVGAVYTTRILVETGRTLQDQEGPWWGMSDLTVLPELLTSFGWRTEFTWGEDFISELDRLPSLGEVCFQLTKEGPVCRVGYGTGSTMYLEIDGEPQTPPHTWKQAVARARALVL